MTKTSKARSKINRKKWLDKTIQEVLEISHDHIEYKKNVDRKQRIPRSKRRCDVYQGLSGRISKMCGRCQYHLNVYFKTINANFVYVDLENPLRFALANLANSVSFLNLWIIDVWLRILFVKWLNSNDGYRRTPCNVLHSTNKDYFPIFLNFQYFCYQDSNKLLLIR